MFFLLFQFEKTKGTTFLLDTRRNAEKKVGFETTSFSCVHFWELKFDPGGEEKEEEGTERWGSFFSEETIYRSLFLRDLFFFLEKFTFNMIVNVHNIFF